MVTISGLCSHILKSSENCVYVLAATRKRQVAPQWSDADTLDLHEAGNGIDLIFIDARVNINNTYYREVLLSQKLQPVMRKICGEFFIFQQRNVPAH